MGRPRENSLVARRSFVISGLAVAIATASGARSSPTNIRSIRGQTVTDLSIHNVSSGSFEVSQLPYVVSQAFWDGSVAPTLQEMSQLFGLQGPAFMPIAFDDSSQPGFAAVNGNILNEPLPHEGVLLIGSTMAQRILARLPSLPNGAPVSAALAHEVAHLYQFRRGPSAERTWWQIMMDADGNQSRARAELHADFLSGWCLGKSTQFINVVEMDLAAKLIYELGDLDFNDPNHHGTPSQRYACILRGFFLGRVDKLPADQAAYQGERFVNSVLPMRPEK